MRSSLGAKLLISCALFATTAAAWWFGLYQQLIYKKHYAAVRVNELGAQKKVFDEVLEEYKKLSLVSESVDTMPATECNNKDCCRWIIDQARASDLSILSYTKKPGKSSFRQMMFSFQGNYDALLSFLAKLDYIGLNISCKKLRVSHSGYRLQITYVCGIHTSVKT